MVVLASAITTKNGKTLLSRQFVEMTRARIEGLLAAFPKLISSDKQHTFIETDVVRYVYQPLESLYVILVTNKNSNILEDLDTIHLLAKIVPEYAPHLDEKEVLTKSFDIIFAFDEAISMGYKERVNITQIKHFLTMESHNEEIFKQEEKAKMLLAKKKADEVRKRLDKKRVEEKKMGISGMGSEHISNTYVGVGSGPRSTFANEPMIETKKESPKVETSSSGRKGLQLGKAKKTSGYSQVLKEENVVEVEGPQTDASAAITPAAGQKLTLQILEKIALVCENDGGLKSMEVKGELVVTAFDPKYSQVQIHVSQGDAKDFQFKAHPNMEKNLYAKNQILALKDNSKSYPLGTPSSILKWRMATKDENLIPLSINLWPSTGGGETTVPVEYEKKCDFDLADVVISIPIPGASPVVGEASGSYDYDPKKNVLYWRIPLVDKDNKSGSLEFTVPAAPSSGFFPVRVGFTSNSNFAPIQVVGVTSGGSQNEPLDFTVEVNLSVEQYDIE